MAKVIEITLTANYVRSWGEREGIREIVQNAIDGETEFNYKMAVKYNKGHKTLIVDNIGGSIPKESMLIGFTTKADNEKLIGKFGEGLKLGILALLRAGNTVKIKNNGEIWTPVIEKSANFDADVLKFKVTKSRKASNGLRVLIGNVDPDNWKLYRRDFLFLRKSGAKNIVRTHRGSLLLGPKYRGKVYVKGLKVAEYDDLEFGYDFPDAQVDRDRKMIESYDLEYRTANILGYLAEKKLYFQRKVYEMLQRGVRDVKRIGNYGSECAEKVFDRFVKDQGEQAIPVQSESEAREVEHFGKRGVVVPPAMAGLFAHKLGNFDDIRRNLGSTSYKIVAFKNLEQDEQDSFNAIFTMVAKVASTISSDNIDIAEYRDQEMMGQYDHSIKRIRIARRILKDKVALLQTLVHELCHTLGMDGQKTFVFAVERMLAKVAIYNSEGNK